MKTLRLSLVAAAAVLLFAGSSHAAMTITAATGGTNISADKAKTAPGTATYTTLGNIVLAEPGGDKVAFSANQTNVTLNLTAPTGWEFKSGTGSVAFAASNDITSASIGVTTSTITVTFSVGASSPAKADTLTISGIQVVAVNGLITSSPNGTILRTSGNPGTASFSAGSITNNVTSFGSLSEVAGTANKLGFGQSPTNTVAGVAISPAITVAVQDQFGNTVTTDTRNVTAAISNNPGGGTLSGTTTVAAVAGVATFSTLSINKTGTGYTLAATSSPALTSATSGSFNITPAAAAAISKNAGDTQTGNIASTLGTAIQVKVTDSFGNNVADGTSVTFTPAGGSGSVSSSPVTTTSGLASTNWTLGCTVGSQSVVATVTATAITTTFTATASDVTTRSSLSSGNWSNTAIWSPACVPSSTSDVTINSGHAVTFDVASVTVASLTFAAAATDSSLTLGSNSLTVSGAVHLNQPSNSGVTASVNVGTGTLNAGSIALDGQGNKNTNISLSTGTVNDSGDITFNNSPAQALTITGAGNFNIGGNFGASGSFSFSSTATVTFNGSGTQTIGNYPGASNALPNVVINKTTGSVTAGNNLTIANNLTIQSSTSSFATTNLGLNGNFTDNGTFSSSGIVTFAGSSAQTVSGTAAGTSGVVPFSALTMNNANGLTLSTPASVSGLLTFTLGNITTGSNTLTLGSAGTVSRTSGYVIGNFAKVFAAAAAKTFEVGTANGYSPVTVNATAGTFPGTFTAKATQAAHPNAPGIDTLQRYWTLTNGSITTADLTFQYLDPTDIVGTEAGYSLGRWTGSAWVYPASTLDTTNNLASTTGATSFGDYTLNERATKLIITSVNGGVSPITAGNTFSVVVQARDADNNPTAVSSSTGILLSVNPGNGTSAALGGTLSGTITAGNNSVTISGVTYTKAETNIKLLASATSGDALTAGTSAFFDVVATTANKLGFAQQPTNTVAGVAISPAITVQVQDSFGNLVTTDTRNVTLAIANNAGGGTLSGTATVAASGGVATFSTLSINKTGTGYTLGATSSPALTAATSSAFNITPAASDHLTFLQQPTNAVAGVAISPAITVRIEDAFNNLATGDTRNVTLAIGTNAGGGTLSGTATVAASGGIATFSTLSIDKTGTGYTLAATSSPSLTGATSSTFNITPAAANHLAFLQQPTNTVAGVAISPAITVRVEDSFNNLVTSDTRNVTLAIGTNAGGGTLSGTATVAASGGIATFSTLSIDKTGTGYTLAATSSPALTGATSSTFNITPAAANHLTFLQQPTNAVAGVAISPAITVRVEDVFSNLVTTDSRNVTLAIATNAGGGTLSGTTTVAASGGVATFSDLSINKTGIGYTLAATSSPALTGATSSGFNITPAAPDHLAFLQQPTNTVAGVAISPAITVRVEDSFNNLVTSDTRNVTLAIGTNAGGGALSGTATVAASGGIATFSTLSIDKTGTGYTLAATSSPALTGATSSTFNITPAAANHLAFLQQPTNTVAGVAISPAITVRVEDSFNNLVTSDTRNVTLAIGTNAGGGTLSGTATVAASGGIATFSTLSIDKTGTGYTLAATSSPALTGATSSTFNITPAAANHLTFLQQPTDAVAGVAISPAITVRVEDVFSNLVTTDTRNVTLVIGTNAGGGTLSGTTTVAASGGVATFSDLSINKTGTGYTLAATSSPALTGATSNTFNITPAAADHLTFLQQPTDTIAGVAIAPAITVRIEDAFANLVTPDSSTQVTLAIATNAGGGTLSGTTTVTASGGVATFSTLSINKTGSGYTLAATSSPSLTGATSSTFNITPASPDHLRFAQQPTNTVAGVAISPAVTVRVEDAFDNLVTTDTRNVTLAIASNPGGGTLSGTATVAASGGIATFSTLSINKTGTGYTLAATSSPSLTGATSSTFNITPAAPDHLTFLQQPTDAVAGVAISPAITVRIEDVFANLVTSDTRNVTLAIGTNAGGGTLSGTTTVAAIGGIATFSDLSIQKTGIGYTLAATSSPSLTGATSSTFNISPAAPDHLTFLQQPTDAVAGVAISPAITVRIEDVFANLVTTDTRNVTLAIGTNAGGGTLSGTTTVAASGGVATFSDLSINKTGTGYTLAATSTPSLTGATSITFNITPAAADHLTFLQQPTDAVAGVAISPAITVRIEDAFSNLVTPDSTTQVTLAIGTNAGGGTLSGTTTVTASAGIATFSNLSINKTGAGYTLAATSSPSLTGATSSTFNITPAAPDHLRFAQQPTNTVAGVSISPAVTVRIEDAFDNLVTSDTRNVTAAIGTNPGSGTLSGTTTVAATGGIATFSNLSINKTGTGYTLAVSSSPVLTGATSSTFNVTPAAADHLTFFQQPTDAVAGVAISPAITVRVEDVFANLVTSDTRNVTLAIGTNPGGGTLSGTTTVAASGGIATFSDLSINKSGTGYTLSVSSSPALTGATSSTFNISPAAPDHLTFLQQPTDAVAGVAISPAITVRIEDLFANLVTSDTRNVTLAIATNAGGGTLSGTTTVAASGGVATFSNLSINKTGTGYTMAATSSPVLTGTTSSTFNITPAAADHLTFLQQPTDTIAGVAIAPAITVRIEDAFANLVTTDTRNVTLAIGTNAGGGTLSGTTTVAAIGGVATFSNLSINKTGTGYTLAATSSPSLTGATSTGFNITPASPDHLRFAQQPANTVAGVAISPAVTVRVEDAFDNLVTSDTRNVTLAIASNPGSGTLSGTATVAASGGIATFSNLSINKTGTGYTLAATSSPSLTGATSSTFNITPAAADHLTFLQQPTDAVAGVAISPAITVRIEDVFANLVTSDTRNVTLAIGTNAGGGTLSGTTTVAAIGGIATFSDLSIQKTGIGYTLAATSSPSLTGATSSTFNITPAAPDHLTFLQQPTDAVAGVAISPAITVRIEDVFTNLVTTDSRNVTLAIGTNAGGGTLSGTTTVAASGGIATFSDLSINKTGTGYTLAATSSPSLTGATSSTFNITPAAPDHLTFLQQPANTVAGVAITPAITVRIEDVFANLVTTDTRNVTLAIGTNPGGGTLSGTTTIAASGGIATFNNLSINKTGTGYTLAATSSPSLTGATSSTFNITPAAPDHLTFLQQPTNTVAGVAITPAITVRIEDAFANLVTSDTRNVTLAIGTNAGGGTLSGTATVAASGGIATFSNLSINKTGTGYTLAATSSPSLTGATSSTLNLTPAAADHLTLSQQPTDAVAGVAISPAITVRIEDAFANLVTGDTRNVTLAIATNAGGGTLSGTTTVAASGGIATFSDLSINKTGIGYTLAATSSPSLTGATSSTFNISPAAPDHLTFLQQPTDAVAGVAISPAITVRIEDVFANLVTTDSRNVTLAIGTNAGGGTLSGTTTVAASGGIATFSDLSINKTGTGYTLAATSSPSLTGATSSTFNITPAAADHLTFLQQPANTVAGVAITPAITVRIEDVFANLVTTDTRNVTLAIGTNAGGGTLSGTTTVAASGGIATFSNLSINKTGAGYTLAATSSPSLTGATSGTFNITPAAPDHLTFLQQPTNTVAGVAITPAITVRIEDAFANLVTSDTRNVTLAIGTNPGGGTLSGTATVAASGGIATFSNLSINKSGTGYTLAATSSPALTGATSSTFNVTPAAADHLTFLQQPTDAVAGVAISPAITVRVEDALSNLVTSDTRNVTLAIGTNAGGGTLSGTTTVAASGGVATFSNLSINKTGAGYTLAATSSPSLTGATSSGFNITPAAPDHLTFLQQPTNTVAGVAISPAITVRVEDVFANLVTTDTRNVILAIGTNPGGGTLSGTTTVAAIGGVATFSNLSINKTGTGYTLAATSSPSLTGATSSTFNITPAAADHLTLLQQPTNTVAGVAITPAITVRVEDAFANLVTSDTRNVTLAIGTNPGGGTLSGTATVAASGGIATFNNLSINKAGIGYTLAATSSPSLTGATSSTFNITPAAATHLTVSAPASATAGSAFSFTVTALDQFNNTATGYAGTVHFTSSDGSATLPVNSTLTSGTGTFSATLKTAGSQTITATDTVTSSITGTSNSINVSPAAATHLTVSAPASATASVAFTFTVTALDAFNNTATGYSGTVHFTSTDGSASLPSNSTLTSGAGTFSATLTTAGSQTITATDTVTSSITGTSGSINVSASGATHFTVSAPASATAGSAFTFTVTALDASNNTATGYGGTVHFTSSDGAATLPTDSTLTNGTGTFSATLTTAGSQTITATDTGSPSITGTSGAVTVSAGPLHHFRVEAAAGGNIGSQAAGVAFSIKVTARDLYDNVVPSFNGTVAITSTGTLSNGGGTSPAFTNGVLASLSVTISNSGTFTITATNSGGSETGTSNSFAVGAGGDVSISISGPATASPSSTQAYVITVTNLGSTPATGVNVSASIPSGWSIVTVTGACSSLPCSLGTLAGSQTATINVSISIPSGAASSTPYSIGASVATTSSDPVPSNNSATASTLVQITNCPVITNFSPANSASNVALHTVLTWTGSGADSYDVYFGEGNSGCTHLFTSVTTPHVDLSGLLPGTTYSWMVIAHHAGCPTVQSVCMSFTTAAVCNAPRLTLSLIAEASSTATYHVTWDDIGATTYELQESTTDAFAPADTFHLSATQMTFMHEVSTTTAFYYRARAVLDSCAGVAATYSDPIRIVIDPKQTPTGTEYDIFVESGSSDTITQTVHVDAPPSQLAIKAATGFVVTSDQPWLTVSPASGSLPADIVLSASAKSMPAGTSVGLLHVSTSGGTSVETIKVSLNVLEPMSLGGKDVPPSNASIIPGVAHAAGIGSQWQSDVRIYNPGSKTARYLLLFTPAGADGTKTGRRMKLDVASHATVALDDIVRHQFGFGALNDSATGALEIRPAVSTDKAIVTSRTYNVATTGTYGQFIPAFAVPTFAGMGDTMSLQQVAQSDAYRTNVGFVEASGLGAALEIRIYDDGGHLLNTSTALLQPFEQTQTGSLIAQQGLSLADGRIEVDVKTPGAKVVAYASVVDNKTSDPLLVSPAIPAHISETRYVIPGVVELVTPSAAWRTDVRIYNSTKTTTVANATFMVSGVAPATQSIVLAPGEVKAYDNIVRTLFGMTGTGGVLHVTTASPSALVVTSRTYDAHSDGTFGQFIPALVSSDGTVANSRSLQILGVEQSDDFRANVGLVEIAGQSASVDLTITLPDGRSATQSVSLAPYQFVQFNSLARSLGFDSAMNARVTITVTAGQGRVAGYASVVDNHTQDPTYIPAQ